MPVVLTVLGSAVGVSAQPAAVFVPHMELIESKLPEGLAMRLPTEILLSGHSDIEESKLVVRLFPSETPQSFTVGIFTCERGSHPCLLGSFSVDSNMAASAQRDLQRHQAIGDRIPLVDNIDGYLIEGPLQNPPHQFSTIMWQQNNMMYTISFPAFERENIVLMAVSMARGKPVERVNPPLVASP
jgi:hypothetical protein